jgi:hypothetical protein
MEVRWLCLQKQLDRGHCLTVRDKSSAHRFVARPSPCPLTARRHDAGASLAAVTVSRPVETTARRVAGKPVRSGASSSAAYLAGDPEVERGKGALQTHHWMVVPAAASLSA